jgi:hypothetical protein
VTEKPEIVFDALMDVVSRNRGDLFKAGLGRLELLGASGKFESFKQDCLPRLMDSGCTTTFNFKSGRQLDVALDQKNVRLRVVSENAEAAPVRLQYSRPNSMKNDQ